MQNHIATRKATRRDARTVSVLRTTASMFSSAAGFPLSASELSAFGGPLFSDLHVLAFVEAGCRSVEESEGGFVPAR